MPSPFPGMDPYLEGNWWTSFHAFYAPEIARQLNRLLRPKYIASPEREYTAGALDDILISPTDCIPDVTIRKSRGRAKLESNGTVITAPVRLRTQLATKEPHFHVLIRDTAKRRLVTAIELLSPTNKRSGRKFYLRKRRQFMHSSVHLLEIDLHHQGKRMPMLDPYPPGAYFVLLNRTRRRSWTEVWPIRIDEPLPTVPVPLLGGDADVPLDLQQAFTEVYDAGGFDLAVDYRKPPDVELSAEEAAWLDEHLREKKAR